jgi:UDP-N-acetylmuramoyl-tripeptide--D-alanyl-D-alanine ligase
MTWTLRERHWQNDGPAHGYLDGVDLLPLTAAHVTGATGGRILRGTSGDPIGRVAIDSRTVQPGDFFVAVHGERFDGHAFVGEAVTRGATGAMVHDASQVPDAAPLVIQVDETTRALQQVARDVRRRSGARVAAVTGSAGKTTTKEIAAEFLSSRYRVFRNKGNLNNHIGLPLSLLELRSRPDVAVVELGMNHPGEIRTLIGIAEPEVRVWTNVGDAHIGYFGSAEAIADAKAEITEQARRDDVLIANADDARVMNRAGQFPGRIVTFGISGSADVRATGVKQKGVDGTEATVTTPQGDVRIETPLIGMGNLANILAATAVALEFDVTLDDVRQRAAHLAAAKHRGELLRLPGGITLLDDSYNSSPAALKRALEVMAGTTGSARKVAVLGEMLELGSLSTALHRECGAAAAAAGLDLLIAVGGPAASALAAAAMDVGMPERSVSYVATSDEAAAVALRLVRPGDLILVKGSRGIGTDVVVERLKEEFA